MKIFRIAFFICVLISCRVRTSDNNNSVNIQFDHCQKIANAIRDSSGYFKSLKSLSQIEIESQESIRKLLFKKNADTSKFKLEFILNSDTGDQCVSFNKLTYIVKDSSFFRSGSPLHNIFCLSFFFNDSSQDFFLIEDNNKLVKWNDLSQTIEKILTQDLQNEKYTKFSIKCLDFLFFREPDNKILARLGQNITVAKSKIAHKILKLDISDEDKDLLIEQLLIMDIKITYETNPPLWFG